MRSYSINLKVFVVLLYLLGLLCRQLIPFLGFQVCMRKKLRLFLFRAGPYSGNGEENPCYVDSFVNASMIYEESLLIRPLLTVPRVQLLFINGLL